MLIFWIKEALKIFGRAKSSFLLSLISLCISILLITASFYTIFFSHQIENRIKEKFIINIFLNDSLSVNSAATLRQELENKTYTGSIDYFNKDKAAEIFIQETGEDFRKMLDYNPIPASITLKLKVEYVEQDSIQLIKKEIEKLTGVDDIVFEHETLEKLVNALKEFQNYIFIITIVLILVSVYITYSTIRLVVTLKHDELDTMKLVGAKLSTIKMPIILNEVLTGLFASLLSFLLIKALFHSISAESLPYLYKPPNHLLLLILLIGPAISLIVSIIVLRNITLKI
jgi:cell division transport system permease protein